VIGEADAIARDESNSFQIHPLIFEEDKRDNDRCNNGNSRDKSLK